MVFFYCFINRYLLDLDNYFSFFKHLNYKLNIYITGNRSKVVLLIAESTLFENVINEDYVYLTNKFSLLLCKYFKLIKVNEVIYSDIYQFIL